MLQLRFQGMGIGYFETLMPGDPSYPSMHATTPTESPVQPAHTANPGPDPNSDAARQYCKRLFTPTSLLCNDDLIIIFYSSSMKVLKSI